MSVGSHRKILLVDGHPDPDSGRLVHTLCEAYAHGAAEAGMRYDASNSQRLLSP